MNCYKIEINARIFRLLEKLSMPIEYTRNNDGHFVCTFKDCNKIYDRQNTMYYHIMRHRKQFAYNCQECEKGFIQKSAFLHHMAAIHPGNKEIVIPNKEKAGATKCSGNNETDCSNATKDNVRISQNTIETDDKNVTRINNPYDGRVFTCPCCKHETKTKANALVHYARIHAKDWIPTYNKETGCTHCKEKFNSIAAYLYHCTGCIPANNNHRAMISRMIDNE
jgi:hypothetical protein